MACTCCRRRKLRCNNDQPCNNCHLHQRHCDYEAPRKRGPKRRLLRPSDTTMNIPGLCASNEEAVASDNIFGTVQQQEDPAFVLDDRIIVSEQTLLEFGDAGGFSFDVAAVDDALLPAVDTSDVMDTLDPVTWDLFDLGQFERMPQQDLIDHLTHFYFDRMHKYMPSIHQARYLAGMHLAPQAQPPMCLRYIIWTVASAHCQCHKGYTDIFYRRARQYIENDEMKNPPLTTIAHVQCWALMAFYESTTGFSTRAWMSNRRSVAMAQIIGLHRIDQQETGHLHNVSFYDEIEIEQGRRAFWATFCSDRWASAGTGLPRAMDDIDITSNLPCSDEAFRMESSMSSQSLQAAIEYGLPDSAPLIAGSVLAACILGRIMVHCNGFKDQKNESDVDASTTNIEHRTLDTTLTKIFLLLPRHLRFQTAQQGSSVAFFNICLHCASIFLHLAAIDGYRGEDKGASNSHRRRCESSAKEVFLIMRMTAHLDPSQMEPFTASGLYTASTVLIKFFETSDNPEQDLDDLRFALDMMGLLQKYWNMTSSFIMRMRQDLKRHNIDISRSMIMVEHEINDNTETSQAWQSARLLAGVLRHS